MLKARRVNGFLCLLSGVLAIERCSFDVGGGFCPEGNTCCVLVDGTSGCIPSDLGQFNATCCNDGISGCGVGFTCQGNQQDSWCQAGPTVSDPLVQTLPRYQLCHTDKLLDKQYLKIGDGNLEYYSSHGSILSQENLKNVRTVVVVIHGAGRNADDYFCSTMATVDRQPYHIPETVLIVAPRFPVETDSDVSPGTLSWKDDGAGGSWRYGGKSVTPIETSSFSAVDHLVQNILKSMKGDLQQLTIAGHSAGGQFSQRWSLLSNTWQDENFRGVVANPSSYVFLTPLRFLKNSWQLPNTRTCPEYNSWEWGLMIRNISSLAPVPYVEGVVEREGRDGLNSQFRNRSMVYLVGGRDVCTVPHYSRDGWCYSHGLETTCMDMAQGRNRRERNANYVASLRLLGYPTNLHYRKIVANVGHDHSLMFHSKEGLEAIHKPKRYLG